MAYLVRRVKDVTPHRDWETFQQRYQNILLNVPTQNRHILWDDLEDATPPVFGRSQPDDLLWKERLIFLPNFDRDEEPPAENTPNEGSDGVYLPPFFCDHQNPRWYGVAVHICSGCNFSGCLL